MHFVILSALSIIEKEPQIPVGFEPDHEWVLHRLLKNQNIFMCNRT